MEKENFGEHNQNNKKKDVYLIGGSDLEMHQIKKRLKRSGQEYIDKNLKWGAKIDDYTDEIKKSLEQEKIPVAIELSGADKIEGVVDIDHHGEKSNRPASISQVMERAGLKMSFIDELVAANDSAYIPGMEAKIEEHREDFETKIGSENFEKLKSKLINLIRAKDRQIQGISQDQEQQAEKAIKHLETECRGLLTIVRMPHSKTATVTDRLFGKYKNLVIISNDGEINFFGDGKLCQDLQKNFASSWSGGSGLGKKGENAYWGISDGQTDVLEYIKKSILDNSEK